MRYKVILAICLLLIGSGVARADLTTGLILDYSFDGQPTDYTVVGAMKTVDRSGNPAGAYFFNGINNYLDLPDVAPNRYTVSIWVNAGWGNVGRRIIPIVDGWTNGEVFMLQYRENFELADSSGPFGSETGSYTGYTGPGDYVIGSAHPWATETTSFAEQHLAFPTSLVSGEWHHLALTYDGTFATLYLDGAAVGVFEFHSGLPTGGEGLTEADYLSGIDLALGRSGRMSSYFYGTLDEFKLYNRALSADEVAALAR